MVANVDVLYSLHKEIHFLFKLQHKWKIPLACAIPSGPIPTRPVACMPKTEISYADAYYHYELKLGKLPVLVSWDMTSSIMVPVPMIGNQQYSSAQANTV